MTPNCPKVDRCRLCGASEVALKAEYSSPPPQENVFSLDKSRYYRRLYHCRACNYFFNVHGLESELARVYAADYGRASYGEDLAKKLEMLIALPLKQSSNEGRVAYLETVCVQFQLPWPGRLLDVGSGTAVFGLRMKRSGWQVTALDVDPRLTQHAKDAAGLTVITGALLSLSPLEHAPRYDLITFNKVLEHLPEQEARATLEHARQFLAPHGAIYLELPDGEAAWQKGPDRQEFFIEHYGAYSVEACAVLARAAGLEVIALERLTEVNEKFTVRGLFRVARAR